MAASQVAPRRTNLLCTALHATHRSMLGCAELCAHTGVPCPELTCERQHSGCLSFRQEWDVDWNGAVPGRTAEQVSSGP